ncbi:nucleolar complex protein 3 homolog [Chrysoperla carnea]|uniref:nucleolar complex protein 3 homolog n=1 Tax=Chrysoperla carnea TaxID=189513 RepID=UPI001D085BBC|nr:nucleolar complex protein 3 homolog [Chrysoperla carnea]
MVKISKAKRNNQTKNKLVKQGKIKKKKQKQKQINIQQNANIQKQYSDDEESDHGQDLLDMVETDDLNFLKNSVINRSYSMLKKIRVTDTKDKPVKRKRKSSIDENLEEQYEEDLAVNNANKKKVKMMLPVKTDRGIVEQMIEVEDVDEDEENNNEIKQEDTIEEEQADSEDNFDYEDAEEVDKQKPLTTAELLALREKKMRFIKEKVGVICSGMLEDPEGKINNTRLLFNLMDEATPEVYLFTKKLIAVSLLEVFKDLLPSYAIREQDTKEVKLKKDTLKLMKFETQLLQSYKTYLQKLEKLSNILTPKKGNTTKRAIQEIKLAETAILCMCELLMTHPYFNYSQNIVQVIVPFLNHKLPNIRELVRNSIISIFKEDKKGEITLIIIRKINLLVKLKAESSLHVEVLEPLLALRIKDVNMDQEKENELKQKKLKSHKQNLIQQMSKKERKRKKKLAELNKELLETQAEESKTAKHKLFTEITQFVFTIYFRILKHYPKTKILSVTLEGLAKFAHCINIDFYTDLVNVINNLLDDDESLGYREQLHCVLTVITILSGQGDVLNIDPLRFYAHLYKNLFEFHAGTSHSDYPVLLQTLEMVLIKRRKKISQKRLASFAKRLCTMALLAMHNGSLACLCFVKTLLQLTKSIDILLDCDPTVGDGHYLPFSDDPEYTNASNSALWELILLQRHYHPIVRKMALYVSSGCPASGDGGLAPELKKLNSEELFTEFDSSQLAFKPTILPPKVCKPTGKIVKTSFIQNDFGKYCKSICKQKISSVDYFDIP